MIHKGEFPQWGGGGEAWCSPTSTVDGDALLQGRPEAGRLRLVASTPTSFVDHAARYTYDHRYDGTGNWPFNTAYAADYALDSFVTRLANLRDAEAFIKAGIPLVASIAFGQGRAHRRTDLVDAGPPAGDHRLHARTAGSSPTTRRRPRTRPCAGSTRARSSRRRGSAAAAASSTSSVRPSKALPADTARW